MVPLSGCLLWLAFLTAISASNEQSYKEWKQYRSLFESKRRLQMEAIENIVKLGDEGKQKKMIGLLTDKLFQVLASGRARLLSSSYVLGPAPPEDESIKESLSLVFENTLFFSDIMLRFPNAAHAAYDSSNDRAELFAWCVDYVNSSGIFAGTAAETALGLVSQEANLIPRDPSYKNPYHKPLKPKRGSLPEETEQESPVQAKKAKKTRSRGPRLSSLPAARSEL